MSKIVVLYIYRMHCQARHSKTCTELNARNHPPNLISLSIFPLNTASFDVVTVPVTWQSAVTNRLLNCRPQVAFCSMQCCTVHNCTHCSTVDNCTTHTAAQYTTALHTLQYCIVHTAHTAVLYCTQLHCTHCTHCSTVQYCTAHNCTHCSTVQHSTAQYCTAQYTTAHTAQQYLQRNANNRHAEPTIVESAMTSRILAAHKFVVWIDVMKFATCELEELSSDRDLPSHYICTLN